MPAFLGVGLAVMAAQTSAAEHLHTASCGHLVTENQGTLDVAKAATYAAAVNLGDAMSTGRFNGDGRQAMHWKDDAFTGETIGILDPTSGPFRQRQLSQADLIAFDVIGHDIDYNPGGVTGPGGVPEPASWALLIAGFGLTGAAMRRRRQVVAA
jgi:hypothetical protein